MPANSERGAIIYATGMEERTISRHFAPEENSTLLEYVLDSVWTVADELFVVFNNEPSYSIIEAISPFGVKVLTVSNARNAILTIADAFKSSRSEHSLLVTECVPLLKPNVALALFESARNNDSAMPRFEDGRVETMLAVYRRNAFTRLVDSWKKPFGSNIQKEMALLSEQLFDVGYLAVEELREIDPELDSFLQVKDEKTLFEARQKASIKAKRDRLKKIAT